MIPFISEKNILRSLAGSPTMIVSLHMRPKFESSPSMDTSIWREINTMNIIKLDPFNF
jgi:hypothetical protein